jgi:hypothetical protein
MFAKIDLRQMSFYSFRGPDASCMPGKKIAHSRNDYKIRREFTPYPEGRIAAAFLSIVFDNLEVPQF